MDELGSAVIAIGALIRWFNTRKKITYPISGGLIGAIVLPYAWLYYMFEVVGIPSGWSGIEAYAIALLIVPIGVAIGAIIGAIVARLAS